jgi:hypothetical protein
MMGETSFRVSDRAPLRWRRNQDVIVHFPFLAFHFCSFSASMLFWVPAFALHFFEGHFYLRGGGWGLDHESSWFTATMLRCGGVDFIYVLRARYPVW